MESSPQVVQRLAAAALTDDATLFTVEHPSLPVDVGDHLLRVAESPERTCLLGVGIPGEYSSAQISRGWHHVLDTGDVHVSQLTRNLVAALLRHGGQGFIK